MGMIHITDGPSLMDPLDIARIHVLGVPGCAGVVTLTTIGWRARLAVWLLRAYVRDCVKIT